MAPTNGSPEWSEVHGDAVREAAPEVPRLTATEQAALWQRIETSAPLAARRRPRWKVAVAGLAALGLVGVAGAATGDVLTAHTGKGPVSAEDAALGGPGEKLDPSAPDFADVYDGITADIRFPTADSRERALSWQVEDSVEAAATADYGGQSIGALRMWAAWYSLCAWSNAWAVALRAGDTDAESEATEVILGAHTWPAITDTDPLMGDESPSAWVPELEQAVGSDDRRAARAALSPNQSCMPGLAPELRLGKRW